MSGIINSRIQLVKPSETLAVKARANELIAKGFKVISLGPGEPDIDTPEHIKQAAIKALQDGKTKYTEVPGIPPLREALAAKLTEQNGIKTKSSDVIVTAGGKQALYTLFQVTLNPADEVLIPTTYWVSYPDMVALAGGNSVFAPSSPKNGYKIKPEELARQLTPRTKFVIINGPSNPTGAAYTEAELKELGKVIKGSNAYVISDEVYEKVVFGGFKFVSFAAAVPELASRTVTINAFSKTYSMTGWRVGYATGPTEIISAMIKHQGQCISNVTSIAQYAALAALTGPQDFIKTMNENFYRRMRKACDYVEKSNGLTVASQPEGAFYLFIRIDKLLGKKAKGKTLQTSQDFTTFLLDEAQVAVVPGGAFGDDAAFRISVAASDESVEEAMERINKAVASLV